MEGRNINSLQGLLRFALEHTRSEDPTGPSAFQQMDPERREFLENVFKSMTVDVIAEFKKAIEVLELDNSSTEEKLDALDLIREYVDNIDFANNFIKIGGSAIIISCLNSESADIRASTANLIAELTQNNPFCQKHFTEKDILPKLNELLNDDERVACAALYAISCLVRHYEQALAAYIKIGGIKCILSRLNENQPKLFVKACFLLNALSTEFSLVRDEFLKCGAFEKLSEFVTPVDQYDVKLETVLSALKTLSTCEGEQSPVIITDELRAKLQAVVERAGDKEECQEIIEYAKYLLGISADNEEDVDK